MSSVPSLFCAETPVARVAAPVVAGCTGVTTTAWPGRKAVAIELRGCNLSCPYCFCPELLGTRRSELSLTRVIEQIERDRERIDGVVITGGEPTVDSNLMSITRRLASLRVPVKLDTNGTFPGVLEALLEERLVTFIALDVKTTPERYDSVTRSTGMWERVRRSIALLVASDVDHEFRTTCYPSALQSADLPRIARELEGGRRYAIQQFRPQRTLDPGASTVRPFEADVLRRAALCCAVHIPTVVRGV